MAGLVRTVDPAIEPVDRQQAKEHLRITDDADDVLIGGLIVAARMHCEEYLARSLIQQTWVKTLDAFPVGGAVMLPRPPLLSVTSIQYVDTAGSTQTWASSEYQVVTKAYVGYVQPAYGYSYPQSLSLADAVTITYVAGYGTAIDDVPADIRHGILTLLTHLYEQRCGGGNSMSIPNATAALWWPHRVVSV